MPWIPVKALVQRCLAFSFSYLATVCMVHIALPSALQSKLSLLFAIYDTFIIVELPPLCAWPTYLNEGPPRILVVLAEINGPKGSHLLHASFL